MRVRAAADRSQGAGHSQAEGHLQAAAHSRVAVPRPIQQRAPFRHHFPPSPPSVKPPRALARLLCSAAELPQAPLPPGPRPRPPGPPPPIGPSRPHAWPQAEHLQHLLRVSLSRSVALSACRQCAPDHASTACLKYHSNRPTVSNTPEAKNFPKQSEVAWKKRSLKRSMKRRRTRRRRRRRRRRRENLRVQRL